MSKDPSRPPYGYAVRREKTCLAGESLTEASYGFVRCCPSGSIAKNSNPGRCCPTEKDCKDEINNPPRCADDSWDLYKSLDGGLFCCEQDVVGFKFANDNAVGCAERDSVSDAVWFDVFTRKIQILLTRHELLLI